MDGFTLARGRRAILELLERTMRNLGVVERHPEFHDIPGEDIELTGQNFESKDAMGGKGSTYWRIRAIWEPRAHRAR